MRVSGARPLPAMGAALLLLLVWAGPLERWAGGHFPAHMLRHMALVALVPPLVVAALPGLSRAAAPGALVGAVLEFAVVWGWHLPALHRLARQGWAAGLAEQASFLAAGLLVWAGALGARAPLAGAGALLLTSMHMTFLGALLILAPRDLYAAPGGHGAELVAQQAGGMIMLAIGTPAYLIGGLWLTARALDDGTGDAS